MKIKLKFGLEAIIPIDLDANERISSQNLKEFLSVKFNLKDFILTSSNGVDLKGERLVESGDIVCLIPKALGGKGGFGSLLRAFGKQITKSTNKDACRDLTGRRIRTVNRDKRLKESMARKAEREKQRDIKKQERRERRKCELEETKRHNFHDPKYDEQKKKIAEDMEDALRKGLNEVKKRKLQSTDVIIKVTHTDVSKEKKPNTMDRMKDWMGVDVDSSDLSSDDDDKPQVAK